MIAEQVNDDGTVFFRVFVKPLVNLIWLAGLVFVLGSLIALWPDAREERRLATRYARAGSAADATRDVTVWLVLGAALAVAVRRRGRAAVPARAGAGVRRARTRSTRRERAPARGAQEDRDRALGGAEGARGRPSRRPGLGRGLPRVVGILRRDAAEALRALDRLDRQGHDRRTRRAADGSSRRPRAAAAAVLAASLCCVQAGPAAGRSGHREGAGRRRARPAAATRRGGRASAARASSPRS